MEKEYICAQTDSQYVKDISRMLIEAGIEGANVCYSDAEYFYPYFKILKKFKKEQDGDPEFNIIYIDVFEDEETETEITVYGNYVHEHFETAEEAAAAAIALYKGETAEVALVMGGKLGGYFAKNTGDPQKNVAALSANAQDVADYLAVPIVGQGDYHMHMLMDFAAPSYIFTGASKAPQIEGVKIYLMSAVVGEHPEYYVVK